MIDKVNKFMELRSDLETAFIKYFKHLERERYCAYIDKSRIAVKRGTNPFPVDVGLIEFVKSVDAYDLVKFYERLANDKIENLVSKNDIESIAKVGFFVYLLYLYSNYVSNLNKLEKFIDVCEKYFPLIKLQVVMLWEMRM